MDLKKILKFFNVNKKEKQHDEYNGYLDNKYLDDTGNVNFREGILKKLFSISFGLISFKDNKEATEAVLKGTTYSSKSTLLKFSIAIFFQLILSFFTMIYSGISLKMSVETICYALLFIFISGVLTIFLTWGVNYIYSYYIKYASYLFGQKNVKIKEILNLNAYWFTATTLTFISIKAIEMILSVCLGKYGTILSILITDIYFIFVLCNYGRSLKQYLKLSTFKTFLIEAFPILTFLLFIILTLQFLN